MIEIKTQHLTKIFEQGNETVNALNDINLEIEEGDIYGVIGMSGAGKSTLVRCLNLLEKPTEGEVYIEGQNLLTLSEDELLKKRRNIGMIFQHFNLLQQKNALENVCFPLYLEGISKQEAHKKARVLLERVGIADKEKTYPSQLSGGQQQRVAIARALATDPKILLCDEATSALDPQTTASILRLLKGINADLGITIVIITHAMSVIKEICNKVAIVEDGYIVENGEVQEIFANPKTKAAKKLILNELPDEDVAEIKISGVSANVGQ